MLNIGLWGRASRDVDTFVQQNQLLERKVVGLGGRKVLYSHTYYTEEEFWEVYDKGWYQDMRERYSASSLPTVYEKVNVDLEKMNPKKPPWLHRLLSTWPIGWNCSPHSRRDAAYQVANDDSMDMIAYDVTFLLGTVRSTFPTTLIRLSAFMEDHKDRVRQISHRVRTFFEREQPFRIYHGTTNTTRKSKLLSDNVINTSGLDHVLQVNVDRRVAIVEPNVSMAKLVEATLEYGMLPPVVMEFPAITVGGGFSGTSGESSSFKWGFFERTISKIEIVLADGEVVDASKGLRADLFYGAGGSFGTLGVITLLEIDLIPAMPYVELRYQPVSSAKDAVCTIEHMTAAPKTQYLEGIMFGSHSGVVISGHLVDGQNSESPVVRFTRAQDPWFYLHAEEVLRNESEVDEYRELVPIVDYLFRYDRGAFWGGKYSFEYFYMPFNWVTRWILDGLLRTKTMYHALHKSHLAEEYIVQDISFPYATLPQFVEFLDQKFGFYPLWLCPLKVDKEFPLHPRQLAAFDSNAQSPGMMMNVGLWGPGPRQYEAFVLANRNIEHKTKDLGGLKCFYAQAFYSNTEFWDIYDKTWYDALRSSYKATSLRSVDEKVNVDLSTWVSLHRLPWKSYLYERFKQTWPVRGAYGALHALCSKEYLLG